MWLATKNLADMSDHIYSLNCEELVEYLNQKGFSSEVCQVIKG